MAAVREGKKVKRLVLFPVTFHQNCPPHDDTLLPNCPTLPLHHLQSTHVAAGHRGTTASNRPAGVRAAVPLLNEREKATGGYFKSGI